MSGLPPVLFHVGEDEILLDDSRRFASRIEAAGGVAELHIWEGMTHVFASNIAAHDMGAHPALLWAADHPNEIACLVYMEVPTMLAEFLTKVIVYTPEAMAKGSMWWWILPLAPGVPERLIVGHERASFTWFYEGATADPASITQASIEETLRSFSGTEGVLGALGVYSAAFTTIEQTTPLQESKVEVPVLAIGGEKALGAKVAQMVEAVAKHVTGKVIPACGHFIPEEDPAEFLRLFQEFVGKVA